MPQPEHGGEQEGERREGSQPEERRAEMGLLIAFAQPPAACMLEQRRLPDKVQAEEVTRG